MASVTLCHITIDIQNSLGKIPDKLIVTSSIRYFKLFINIDKTIIELKERSKI